MVWCYNIYIVSQLVAHYNHICSLVLPTVKTHAHAVSGRVNIRHAIIYSATTNSFTYNIISIQNTQR